MNQTSKEIRRSLKVFNNNVGILKSVSRSAVLKDKLFFIPTVMDLKEMADKWYQWMMETKVRHTGNNGRFDCDNFAGLAANMIKFWHHQRSTGDEEEYMIFPCALKEKHTINIIKTEAGIWFMEPQTSECWSQINNPQNVIHVG